MMGRFSGNPSTGHKIQRFGRDDFLISWTVDRYIAGSRLRWPTRYSRWTNRAGAERFAKKWDVTMPPEPEPKGGTT